MTKPATLVKCTAGYINGLIPHQKRTIDGKPDPFDYQTHEVCMKCGGSGTIAIEIGKDIPEVKPAQFGGLRPLWVLHRRLS